MTGFGRASMDAPFGNLSVEIQSVNRKYLEVFISLPKELSKFEPEVRKWIGESISRGQVSLRLFLIPNAQALEALVPDLSLLKKWKKKWEKLAKELDLGAKAIDLSFLMQYLPVQTKQDFASDENLPIVRKCVEDAIGHLLKMKAKEGKVLTQDLSSRLKNLIQMLATVEKHTPDAAKKMRQKLFEKMEEVLKLGPDLEERLLREVALFAERVDVTEEITRLGSHFTLFQELLGSKEAVLGRKMDFLIQEMGREINTIGSKATDAKIAHLVVSMKSELEKMREQIQNLE